MITKHQLLHASTRRVWTCGILAVVAVLTVAVWAAHMDGDTSQTAAMLGATIAVTVAATSGRPSCRSVVWTRGRRTTDQ